MRTNKKIYLTFSILVTIFLLLSISSYAYLHDFKWGASEAVSPQPIKKDTNTSDIIYYYPLPIDYNQTSSSNKTTQRITANETRESRSSDVTSPQPTPPTTSTEQREAQIEPSQKPAYIPPPKNITPVVVNTQQSAIEQEERRIDTNYKPVYIPQEAYNATVVAETSEASVESGGKISSTEGNLPIDRCHEFGNVDTSNFTPEQFAEHNEKVKKNKEEMKGKCVPDVSTPPEGAIEIPSKTEEDMLGELILFRELLNSLSEEEREAELKFGGITMEYLEKEIERLRNLTTAKNNTNQETITEETKKGKGDGVINVVTNFVTSLIDNIFSIFR